MTQKKYFWLHLLIVVLSFSSTLISCSVKKTNLIAPYLDSTNTVSIDKYPFEYHEPVIQLYEFVEVRFAGLNPDVSRTLNNYGGTTLETQISEKGLTFSGQQVDKDGNLNFPLIGKVKAIGLTTELLKAELLKRVDSILKDPYVYVGLPKRGVTFLGEIKSPTTVVFSKERANILEFLAQAGSVTDYADITKVKIYRETDEGQRILGNVNLNDSKLFESPFFYPKANDVVYVPSSKKKAMQGVVAYYPIISIIVSIVSLILAFSR